MNNAIPVDRRVSFSLIFLLLCCSLGACTPAIEKLWEYPIGSPIYSTPLVAGDFIIFGSESGTLHAVDKKGHARWQFQAASSDIFSHPSTNGKLVFFGATNQKFYAVDMRGQLQWQFAARERIKSDPAIAEGVAYVTSYDGHIYALKTDTGKMIWQFPEPVKKPEPEPVEDKDTEAKKDEAKEDKTTEDVEVKAVEPVIKPLAFSYAAPVIKDGILYVGNLDGYLYALQTADGKMKWRFKAGEGITSTVWIEGGVIYFGSKDDHVYAIDVKTGQNVIWKFKAGDDVLSSPKVNSGVLYVGSNDNNFYALDLKTGKEKCRFTAQGPIISFGVFYKNLVLFSGGQKDGRIYAINKDTCEKFFAYKTGYKIESDPVLDGDHLYVTSGDRRLYSFKINKTE
ncbi:MAG: PQQ-binding-like beta-propeller repeat protein [Deltaproteobacteria bacterium]|nr:PQQ-binding-like beta-propeller repeat protein [Deltaproteobacteria bacterium]